MSIINVTGNGSGTWISSTLDLSNINIDTIRVDQHGNYVDATRNIIYHKPNLTGNRHNVVLSVEQIEKNMNEKITVTVSQLLNDLANGITRCKGDTGYDESRGSVEEKYGLSKESVKEIFRHPKLANLKVKIPKIIEKPYDLVDDTEEKLSDEGETRPKFGEQSEAQKKRLADKEENKEEFEVTPVKKEEENKQTANEIAEF